MIGPYYQKLLLPYILLLSFSLDDFLLFANLCSLYLRRMYLEQGHDGEESYNATSHVCTCASAGCRRNSDIAEGGKTDFIVEDE